MLDRFLKPRRTAAFASRVAGFFAPLILSLVATIHAAAAQSIDVIRDAEIERVMRSYEDPILKAAGLDPHADLTRARLPGIRQFAGFQLVQATGFA